MRGKNNEDRFSASAYSIKSKPPVPVVLAIVADGIGGHRAGEIASELAVETISQWVARSDGSQPIETLRQAITQASQLIQERSQSQLEWNGMGSTCACCLVISDRLYTANLGDSRIYLIRENQVHQLSTDHTWIQEALDIGLITPEQARAHPNMHIIRRHLGSVEPPEVDFRLRFPGNLAEDAPPEASQGLMLLPGDQLLLCSDGLTDLVQAEEILAELMATGDETALERLVDLANQRGGHDNITVVRLQIPETISAPMPAEPSRSKWIIGCLAAVFLLAVIIGVVFSTGWLQDFWSTAGNPTATQASAAEAAPSATIPPPSPTATIEITPTPEMTIQAPSKTPAVGGPTLTPWPTNTKLP